MSGKIHTLKCDPGPFRDVQLGLKEFEVRYNDRDYKVGDTITLIEHHCHVGEIGGISEARIKYILQGGYGLQPGFVVLGLDVTVKEASK